MTVEQAPKASPQVPTAVILGVFVLALACHVAGFVEWRTGEFVGFEPRRDDSNLPALAAVWLAALGLGLLSLRGAAADQRRRPARLVRHPLCCSCLVPYIEGAHFCPTCACPLTWFAGTGDYETIYARAWIVGKAANHPTRRMHVWLLTISAIGAVAALLVPLWSLTFASPAGSGPDPLAFPFLALGALTAWIWVALAWRSWSRWGLASTNADDDTPPVRYGSPPWWTYDEHWRVPLAVEDEDEFLPEPDESPE